MSSGMGTLAGMAWVQVWQVTIAAAAIGAIVRLCCRDRPRVAYALWMLVVVKSMVPPCWSSPTGVFSWALAEKAVARPYNAETTNQPTLNSRAPVLPELNPNSPNHEIVPRLRREAIARRYPFHFALFAIWVAGFLLYSAFVLAKQIVCTTLIKRSRVCADERHVVMLTELARRLGVKRAVRLIVTSRPIGPAVFGVIRPSILMPASLLAANSADRVELMIAHELIHVRRGDVIAGKIQLATQLVWWFHPLIWWVNREASRERERCCDREVVSGVGCKPAHYARALLCVVEQKSRSWALVATPGVRALEVTSRRLESIMRYAKTENTRASLSARVAFVAGSMFVVPGAGLSLRADQPSQAKADTSAAQVPEKTAPSTVTGFARDKATGRPLAGAQINVTAIGDKASHTSKSAVTDSAGRYTVTDLPKAGEYTLIGSPARGEPYFITSHKSKAIGAGAPLTADLEFVRGIPFRVRVLDDKTGKPLEGTLSYFPINPNNPFPRGIMGYVASATDGGSVCGAFYEAGPNNEGQFLGAVLPGPGILCFSHPYKAGDESRYDRKPAISFPDGKKNVMLVPNAKAGGPLALVPISAAPLRWMGTPLGQFDAVIVVDPRDDAEAATYEIRIPRRKRPE